MGAELAVISISEGDDTIVLYKVGEAARGMLDKYEQDQVLMYFRSLWPEFLRNNHPHLLLRAIQSPQFEDLPESAKTQIIAEAKACRVRFE